MKTYSFTAILADQTVATDELANATFESGCDDATIHSKDGVVFLDFHRDADSFEQAVASAIADLLKANCVIASIEIRDPQNLVAQTI